MSVMDLIKWYMENKITSDNGGMKAILIYDVCLPLLT